jgi:hypothetical protein
MSEETMNRTALILLLTAVWATKAFADGLIWQLPPDGTFVEFRGVSQCKFKPVLAKIALHPDALFGVVQVQYEMTEHEFAGNTRVDGTATGTLTISRKGTDAKSSLPGDSKGNGAN